MDVEETKDDELKFINDWTSSLIEAEVFQSIGRSIVRSFVRSFVQNKTKREEDEAKDFPAIEMLDFLCLCQYFKDNRKKRPFYQYVNQDDWSLTESRENIARTTR